MTDSLVYTHLKKSGLFKDTALEKLTLTPLTGGTNEVFLVTGDQEAYVVKIPKPAALPLIDRKNEYHAGMMTAAAGINLPFCYFDLESGVNITRYQSGSQILTPPLLQREIIWQAAVDTLRKLHQLPQTFQREINIFAMIDFYKRRATGRLPAELADLSASDPQLNAFRCEFATMEIEISPCHNDPMLANFLLTDKQMYLIDWEYAGNNDPCWDLATLGAEAEFTDKQEQQFLDYYFKRPTPLQNKRRYQVYKILSDYLWALWCVVMEDDVNARFRWQRFKTKIGIHGNSIL